MTSSTPAVGDIWMWWGEVPYVLIEKREELHSFNAFNLTDRTIEYIILSDKTFHRWEKVA